MHCGDRPGEEIHAAVVMGTGRGPRDYEAQLKEAGLQEFETGRRRS
jgi:hypothetical protein